MDMDYYKKYEPIDGKWYITKELGSGAFGTVFEITRKDYSDMKAALKVISIPATQSEVNSYKEENYELDNKTITSYFYGFVEEFTKEIRLMAELRGANNIVNIEDYDVKEKEDEFGWDIFIRMELLVPMNRYFATNSPKQSDVIKLGIDICKALEVCQKYQILHRDIKPANIFVSKTGDFKLGDFGVARTLEKTSSGLSKKGTYTYMAPEVFKGDAYSSNVDIYSLGIVMYRLLNNNLEPFRHDKSFNDGEQALEMRMRGKTIPKPQNADENLSKIILKACAFDPKERYANPLEMRTDLENYLNDSNDNRDMRCDNDARVHEMSANGNLHTDEEATVSIFSSAIHETENVNTFSGKDETKQDTISNFENANQDEPKNVSKNLELKKKDRKADEFLSEKWKKRLSIGMITVAIVNLICMIFLPIYINRYAGEISSGIAFFVDKYPLAINNDLMDRIFLIIIVAIDLSTIGISIAFLKNKVKFKKYMYVVISTVFAMTIIFLTFLIEDRSSFLVIPMKYIGKAEFKRTSWLAGRCSIVLTLVTICAPWLLAVLSFLLYRNSKKNEISEH